jgi:hypothetical protein
MKENTFLMKMSLTVRVGLERHGAAQIGFTLTGETSLIQQGATDKMKQAAVGGSHRL